MSNVPNFRIRIINFNGMKGGVTIILCFIIICFIEFRNWVIVMWARSEDRKENKYLNFTVSSPSN